MKPHRGGLGWIASTSLFLVLAVWCHGTSAQEVVSGLEPFQAKDYTLRRYGKGGPAQRAALDQLPAKQAPSKQRRQRHGDIQRQAYQESIATPEAIPPGEMVRTKRHMEPADNPFEDETGDWNESGPGPDWDSQGGPDDCDGDTCCRRRLFDCRLIGPWIWDNFSVFGGVQGFKGRPDFGLNGNLGFHEGFNWGSPLIDCWGVGTQSGLQVVHSDLSGSTDFGANRTQLFYTGGIFHRPIAGCGFQCGVVGDYLHDDFYVEMDVAQVRAELSFVGPNGHELGSWVAVQTRHDSQERNNQQQVEWRPVNMYAFFYRRQFCSGATGRFWSGLTGNGEALIGADAIAPLSTCWSIATDFNYRIPKQNNGAQNVDDPAQEGWGLAISLVWTPCAASRCGCPNPYRPLFNVADNATMMINQKLTNLGTE